MARRFVTVNDVEQLPPEVLAKLGETMLPRIEFDTVIATKILQALNNRASTTPVAGYFPLYGEDKKFTVENATSAGHPINKGQLDARIPVTGIPLATELASGLMSAADKVALRKAGWQEAEVTYDNLRTPGNWLVATDPSAPETKLPVFVAAYAVGSNNAVIQWNHTGYRISVNGGVWNRSSYFLKGDTLDSASLTGTVPAALLPLVTPAVKGAMSTDDKKKLDASTDLSTANTLVQRDSAGNARFNYVFSDNNQSTAVNSMTRKDYVDAQVATRSVTTHKHVGTDITSAIPANLIPVVTLSTHGAMLREDKAKLDASTVDPTASTLVLRGTAGEINVGATTAATHAARKDYVDAKTWPTSRIVSGIFDPERIPTVTVSAQGAMTAEDKKKLDTSTNANTGSSLVSRAADGSTNFSQVQLSSAPTLATHGATKSYVDGLVSEKAATDHTHANVTTTTPGFMTAADKSKLDKASNSTTPNTLMMTDANGRYQSAAPSSILDVANKSYVDGKKWDGADITTGTIPDARIANATSALDGLMPKADKAKLDAATTSNTAGSIVTRSSAGRTNMGSVAIANAPVTVDDATRKDYVDNLVATRALASHTHPTGDITGTYQADQLPLVTSTVRGAMYSSDKVLLDSATSVAGANKLLKANASGDIAVNTPTSGSHPANKTYVDGLIAQRAYKEPLTIGGSVDLNTLTESRVYIQPSSANAGTGSNYPLGVAGLLEVFDDGGSFTFQTYTIYGATRSVYVRTRYGTTWYDWEKQASVSYVDAELNKKSDSTHKHSGADITSGTISPLRIANATSSLDGLMAKADKALLDTASSTATANTLVKNDSAGRFQVATPSASTDAANKSYVDNKTWSGSDITSGTIPDARIANATASLDGLMPKADKSKLDKASSLATANTLVMNDAYGRFQVVTPSGVNDAANKSYVDNLIAKQVTLGGEIGNVDLNTVITPGDYYTSTGANATLANNYPTAGAVGTLEVRRFHSSSVWVIQTYKQWSLNRIWIRSANSSTGWNDWVLQASVTYVDAGLSGKSDTSHKHNGADITSGYISPLRIANATSSIDGLMAKADKVLLDTASTGYSTNSLVKTDGAGTIRGGIFYTDQPQTSNAQSLTRKDYVDNKTWSTSDITSGVFLAARIPVATSSVHGAIPAADKALLDTATYSAIANSLMQRTAAGQVYAADPTNAGHVATKSYVDELFVGTALSTSGGTLDTIVKPGVYTQSSNGGASSGTNYPAPYAGLLEVHISDGGSFVYQRYTPFVASGNIYYRARYNGSWNTWKEVVNTSNVTKYAQGELPKMTPGTAGGNLDGYKTAGSYLVGNGGMSSEGGLLEVFVAADGDICQRLTVQGTMNKGGYKIRWYNEGPTIGSGRSWKGWQNGY